jgi:AbrB family looped-hinge helix DNA binding protein
MIPMQGEQQVYHLKVDASGRVVLPADARQRNRIAEGDMVIITEDAEGLPELEPSDRLIILRVSNQNHGCMGRFRRGAPEVEAS